MASVSSPRARVSLIPAAYSLIVLKAAGATTMASGDVGDVGQGDQPVEAVAQHRVPARDRTLDSLELLIGGAG
jgi:hypothetical protein